MKNIQNSIINTSRMVVSFEEKLLDIVSFLSELSYEWVASPLPKVIMKQSDQFNERNVYKKSTKILS